MKKGILVASFGTTYVSTREKTIGAIENKIAESFPEFEIRRAFTSSIVRKRILKNEGIVIDNVDEALTKMIDEGFEEVYVASLHIIGGIEYKKVSHSIHRFKDKFKIIRGAKPLLYSKIHYDEAVDVIAQLMPSLDENEALVLMGHGSDNSANSAYVMLYHMLERNTLTSHVYLGTVEGYPEMDDLLEEIDGQGYEKLYLLPFMIVAGDHAINDMASEEEDSWKSIFESNGYKTECIMKGLGEFEPMQQLFIKRLKASME